MIFSKIRQTNDWLFCYPLNNLIQNVHLCISIDQNLNWERHIQTTVPPLLQQRPQVLVLADVEYIY